MCGTQASTFKTSILLLWGSTPLRFFCVNKSKVGIMSMVPEEELVFNYRFPQIWKPSNMNITKFCCICTKTFSIQKHTFHTNQRKQLLQLPNRKQSFLFSPSITSAEKEFCPETLLSFPSTKPLILCISINIKLNMSKLQNTVKRGILQDYYTN